MDHLTLPSNPEYPVPIIKWYGLRYSTNICIHAAPLSLYDDQSGPGGRTEDFLCAACKGDLHDSLRGWTNFPKRMGWDHTRWLNGDFSHPGEYSPPLPHLLQAWLYEGVLSACTFRQVDFNVTWTFPESVPGLGKIVKLFVVLEDDGSERLFSAKLHDLLDDAGARIKTMDAQLQTHLAQVCSTIMSWCHQLFENSIRYDAKHVLPIPEPDRMSFVLLWEAVKTFHYDTFSEGELEFKFRQPCAFLKAKLDGHFWCPSELQRLTPYGQEVLFYASQLGPRLFRRTHVNCTDTCLEAKIDEKNYEIRHASPGCACQAINFRTEIIGDIWLENGLPLVRYVKHEDTWQLISTELAKPKAYAAVSHVWADGLGNPLGNALPICQIRRIQATVDSVLNRFGIDQQDMPWFLDTLCIPAAGSAASREIPARKQGIASMATVYRSAAFVLIHDSMLRNCDKSAPVSEKLFRAAICPWSYRIWTFQEAKFAQVQVFELANGTMTTDDIREAVGGKDAWKQYGKIKYVALEMLTVYNRKFPSEWEDVPNHPFKTVSTARGFLHRSTTRETDRLVCLATCCDFEQDAIKKLADCKSTDQQTMVFLKLLTGIDPMLAIGAGDRLQLPGFRWAPRSLLDYLHFNSFTTPSEALSGLHSVTKQGLLGAWRSVRFKIPKMTIVVEKRDPRPLAVITDSDIPIFVNHLDDIILDGSNVPEHKAHRATIFLQTYQGKEIAFLYQDLKAHRPAPGELQGILVHVKNNVGRGEQPILAERISCMISQKAPDYVWWGSSGFLRITGTHDRSGTQLWCLD